MVLKEPFFLFLVKIVEIKSPHSLLLYYHSMITLLVENFLISAFIIFVFILTILFYFWSTVSNFGCRCNSWPFLKVDFQAIYNSIKNYSVTSIFLPFSIIVFLNFQQKSVYIFITSHPVVSVVVLLVSFSLIHEAPPGEISSF